MMLSCEYCGALLYYDAGGTLNVGKASIPAGDQSRLALGATGRVEGVGFRVVGGVRYEYERGQWDEWYVELDGVADDDQRFVWLSEDERQITFARPAAPPPGMTNLDELAPGGVVAIGDGLFVVKELGRATCVAGGGQLPFVVLPGEQYPFADLATRDGLRVATLELDEDDRPTCFVGEPLAHAALEIDDEGDRRAEQAQGKTIECQNCGGAMEIPGDRSVVTYTCEYCGSLYELDGEQTALLGKNDSQPPFTLELGAAGELEGKRYEVCGRIQYVDVEGYASLEYVLHNPDTGYLWVEEYNGHFTLLAESSKPAQWYSFDAPRARVDVGDRTYRHYEGGQVRVTYIDGALPYLSKLGDTNLYQQVIDPPNSVSLELDGQELEVFEGRYLPREELAEAFELEDALPAQTGVGACQPYVRKPGTVPMMWVAGAFSLVLGIMSCSATADDGVRVFDHQVTDLVQETTSEAFEIPKAKIISIETYAPVQNAWAAADIALVNDNQEVVMEASSDVEYYEGYEGGEHWTEGSRDNTTFLRAPPPGTYRLIVKGSTDRPGMTMNIGVNAGGTLSRYLWIMFFVAICLWFFPWMNRAMFEGRRWGQVASDDDDD